MIDFPTAHEKQDPAYTFFRHYPVDLRLENMFRDYFGEAFKYTSPSFSTPKYDHTDEQATHHINIKHHIDKNYLNDNSKFLAHVVIEKELFSSCYLHTENPKDDLKDTVFNVVRAVMDAKTKINTIAKHGSKLFYTIFKS
ncbi:hypothetical protein, partial [Salmonella enterica]